MRELVVPVVVEWVVGRLEWPPLADILRNLLLGKMAHYLANICLDVLSLTFWWWALRPSIHKTEVRSLHSKIFFQEYDEVLNEGLLVQVSVGEKVGTVQVTLRELFLVRLRVANHGAGIFDTVPASIRLLGMATKRL